MSPRVPIMTVAATALELALPWYFMRKPLGIMRSGVEHCQALREIFSFGFMLRTLFSPWKGIADPYPKNGFDLNAMAQAFALNCMTRIIGFLFRITAIALGVVAELICAALFACYLLLWLAFPIALPLGAMYAIPLLF
jgi:hypothetical protein